jgi:hypothetical protein
VQSIEEDDAQGRILGSRLIPGVLGGQGGTGGKVCRDEVHWCLGNSSPEFRRRTARSRRNCLHRSGAQDEMKSYQGVALGLGKRGRCRERS